MRMFGETEEKYFVEKGIIFLIRVLQPFRMPRETLNKRVLDLSIEQCESRTVTCTRSIKSVGTDYERWSVWRKQKRAL